MANKLPLVPGDGPEVVRVIDSRDTLYAPGGIATDTPIGVESGGLGNNSWSNGNIPVYNSFSDAFVADLSLPIPLTTVNVTGELPVSRGGTGASTALGARQNLGLDLNATPGTASVSSIGDVTVNYNNGVVQKSTFDPATILSEPTGNFTSTFSFTNFPTDRWTVLYLFCYKIGSGDWFGNVSSQTSLIAVSGQTHSNMFLVKGTQAKRLAPNALIGSGNQLPT